MPRSLLHVFRNTPRGFETCRQALHFGLKTGWDVRMIFPREKHLLVYFGKTAVQVDLDTTYRYEPDSARRRVSGIADELGARWVEQEVTGHTGSTLPDLRKRFGVLSCPRSMSTPEPHHWIPSGVLGPKVRALARAAESPVFLPAATYLPWNRVDVLFGGSIYALRAVQWGLALAKAARVPLAVHTHPEVKGLDGARRTLEQFDLLSVLEPSWVVEENRSFRRILQDLPRTSLVALGAFGTSPIKAKLFGSRTELALETLPQNLLLVGPHCRHPEPDEE